MFEMQAEVNRNLYFNAQTKFNSKSASIEARVCMYVWHLVSLTSE